MVVHALKHSVINQFNSKVSLFISQSLELLMLFSLYYTIILKQYKRAKMLKAYHNSNTETTTKFGKLTAHFQKINCFS